MDKKTFEKLARDSQERIRQIDLRLDELYLEKKEINKRLAELELKKEKVFI